VTVTTAYPPEEPREIVGHGTFRITLQGGGIVKFECWDQDDEGNVKAYWHAPPGVKDMPLPGEEGA
jgi:hypothetical protein